MPTSEGYTLLALKMEEEVTSQGVQAALEGGEGKESDSLLEPPEEPALRTP